MFSAEPRIELSYEPQGARKERFSHASPKLRPARHTAFSSHIGSVSSALARGAFGLLLVLACAAVTTPLGAQTFGGATLRGTVTDPSGAVVPNATLTLDGETTGDHRNGTTNSQGEYYFTALNPSSYTLKIAVPGFKAYQANHITLAPDDVRKVDVTLEIGQTSESVVVSATSNSIVETETGAKDYTINSSQIDNLSIIGRSALELMRILPGVVAPADTAFQTVSMQGGARSDAFNVNGSRGTTNIVRVDGSNYTHMGDVGSAMLTANVDMVQEVKVLASNYAAEYGTSGVEISAVTKAGSREFHGSVYDYIQNPALNANDRSNNYYGVPRPDNKYQYFGGNIGGPVLLPFTSFNRKKRDKLFFFFGAEIQRQDLDNGAVLGTVPTLKQRQGDFSEFLTAPSGYLNQPQVAYIPGTSIPAPNNNLQRYITPLGTGLLNLYPKPNYVDPNGLYNYAADIVSPLNRDTEVLRIDYNPTDSTRLYLRLARDSESQGLPYGTWGPDSTFPLPGNIVQTGLGKSAAINMTTVINPTLTNEVLISATSNILDNEYQDPSAVSLEAVNGQNFYGMFPRVSNYAPLAIFSGAYPGGQFYQDENMPLRSPSDSYTFSDDLSKFSGTHALKFGFHYERFLLFDNDTSCVEGCFDLNATTTPGTTGFDYGDLLVGRMSDFRQGTRVPYNNWKENNYEAYAQDSWKFWPNLTLEYGLRFAYLPAPTNAGLTTVFARTKYDHSQGLLINGDPTQPNGFLLNRKRQVSAAGVNNPPVAWAPRAGFAWDITGKGNTVIRAGSGLFYNRPQKNFIGESVTKGPPNLYQAEVNAFTAAGLGGEGLTFNTLHLINPYTLIGAIPVGVQTPGSYHTPHIVNMSLSISQRLPGNQVLEVSYVGSLARHLPEHFPVDIIQPGTLLAGTVGNADLSVPVNRVGLSSTALAGFTPFPAYASVNEGQYIGTSNYHSLQATLRRQLSSRLQYLVTYTFSKALGAGSGSDYDTVDPFSIRGNSYGLLAYDHTHIVNASYNYSVPDLARGSLQHAFFRGLLDGWQTSGIITLSSSAPIKLNLSGAIANPGIAQAYFGTNASAANAPVYMSDPQLGGTGEGQSILNLNALAIPAYGYLGPYQPPFYLRGPFQSNFDLTFFKNFQISEQKKIQFRAGFFNLFNQAFPNQFGDIDTTLATSCNVLRNNVPNGSGSVSNGVCDPTGGFSWTPSTIQNFGRIVNEHGHRIVQFVLKFYF